MYTSIACTLMATPRWLGSWRGGRRGAPQKSALRLTLAGPQTRIHRLIKTAHDGPPGNTCYPASIDGHPTCMLFATQNRSSKASCRISICLSWKKLHRWYASQNLRTFSWSLCMRLFSWPLCVCLPHPRKVAPSHITLLPHVTDYVQRDSSDTRVTRVLLYRPIVFLLSGGDRGVGGGGGDLGVGGPGISL